MQELKVLHRENTCDFCNIIHVKYVAQTKQKQIEGWYDWA